MPRTSTLLALTTLTVAATVGIGIGVHASGNAVAKPHAVAPATTAVTDAVEPGPTPAVPRPTRPPSVVSIDGRDTPFPAANLTVTRSNRGLHAILCTDDPPAALDAGYGGNSFMFDMRIPADRSAELTATPWEFKDGTSSDATGIFLHGDRDQLQPTAGVRVTFEHDGPDLLAFITGPFIHLDSHDPSVPPERVQVYGCVRCLAAER
jgi:hypothetical protein